MRKTKNGLQACLPIQTIHCAQNNCTSTDNDDRFSEKKKKKEKKEHVHTIAFQEDKQPFSLYWFSMLGLYVQVIALFLTF